MIQLVWDELPAHYPGIEIDAFVVMPNHIHGIIVLVGAGPPCLPCPPWPPPWSTTGVVPIKGNHGGLPLLSKQTVYKGLRREFHQIVHPFADPDVFNRQLQLFRDGDDDASFRRAVELGDDKARHARRF